jgi:hypothetical protein
MEYREIVAVTGIGGLFHLLTTKSDGAIVRNLADKTTKFISARLHNVTPIETIEVYTTGDNVRLQEVFKKMLEHEDTIHPVDSKTADNEAIKSYFKSILPEFDEERVYVSDMKKMLKWYILLKENDLLRFEEAPEETESTEIQPAEIVEEAKPAAKTKAKKVVETTEEPAETASDEKPAKKSSRAKKTQE